MRDIIVQYRHLIAKSNLFVVTSVYVRVVNCGHSAFKTTSSPLVSLIIINNYFDLNVICVKR